MEDEQKDYLEAVEVRLNHLVGMAYSGHRIGTWCFSLKSGHLYFCSAANETYMEKFFRQGGCHEYAFEHAQALEVPFLMSDRNGMIWLGEHVTISGGSHMLIILGPMFYDSTSPEYVEAVARRLLLDGEISTAEATPLRTALSEIPVVSAQTVVAYAKMLHFTVTRKTLATGDIHYQKEKRQQDSERESPEDPGQADYSLIHSQEELFLQCVREGNLNYRQVLNGLHYSVLDLPLSGDPVRSELYKLVASAALCSRAAIEGGLSPKIAVDLETSYLRQADSLTRVTELRELNMQLMDDFVRHVHQARKFSHCSSHIQECCQYIETHLTDDLSIQRIASEIGYAEYYLTRKFRKEMGTRLTDYIKEARLDYARVCLLSTDMSVEEISDLLQFSSRNYFTRVFREKTGKTPTEYRNLQKNG